MKSLPVLPKTLRIQGRGLISTGLTNTDGSTWGATLVSGQAGQNVDVTPVAGGGSSYDYTFTNQASLVTLQSLTVVSNSASPIDAADWAAVKSATNDYVIVQAAVSFGDNSAAITNNPTLLAQAAAAIVWTDGQPVPGNPFQREVSKTTSAKTTVTATLGSSSASLNLWVIWATMSFQFTNTNPSPLPFNLFEDKTENLGIQYFTITNPSDSAAGKMCGIAIITPVGVHSIITNGWNFFQMKGTATFANGTYYSGNSSPPWTNDGPNVVNINKTLIPDSDDKLYTIDGPNLKSVATLDSVEVYKNFYDYITWSNQICCDTNNFWHFQARWKANQTPQFTLIDLGTNIINLPSGAFYPAP